MLGFIGWGPVDRSADVLWIGMRALFLRSSGPNLVDEYVKGCYM
jgi:hypothetical protein